uniref:Uncharacterized protein n=1 Tax=Arundo donax TaxID=35708 RepID=A0A0A9HWE8_ARUDO
MPLTAGAVRLSTRPSTPSPFAITPDHRRRPVVHKHKPTHAPKNKVVVARPPRLHCRRLWSSHHQQGSRLSKRWRHSCCWSSSSRWLLV